MMMILYLLMNKWEKVIYLYILENIICNNSYTNIFYVIIKKYLT